MEEYCITLEQAKRLVELGFEKDCQFRWKDYLGEGDTWYISDSMVHDNEGAIPAYHVGELGGMLPEGTSSFQFDNKWYTNCEAGGEQILSYPSEPTEAQARGALLIYLRENNLL